MEQILRRELKTWQKAFKAKHGRDPTKRDILADPEIAGTYDTWQAVGGDVKAKPKRSSDAASSSKHKLGAREDEGWKTPSKRKSQGTGRGEAVAGEGGRVTASPAKNPFRTPTKPRATPSAVTPGGRSRNPFASPSKLISPPSPARSLIEVEMTPTKRSPFHSRLHSFTPTKSPHRPLPQYIASPSKLRNEARRTPIKQSPSRVQSDAALNAALQAYTPRTKARKRLRGEDVPPTPSRVLATDPKAKQRGLGSFGFGSSRKVQEPATAPNKFSRSLPAQGAQDEEMETESPIKSVARVREGKGFRPLFGSPMGNHRARDVVDVATTSASMDRQDMDDDADADTLMDDASTSPVGGLFAPQLEQRRLRRSRDASPPASTADESVAKRHKLRPSLHLPRDDSDDDLVTSSSPAFNRVNAQSSSPHTDLTVPSSVLRPSTSMQKASSPVRPASSTVHRTIQTLQFSDGEDEGKTITIAPYQRYGSLHSAAIEDEDLSYAIPSTHRHTTPPSSDSETEPSLAGLKLSPVRYAKSDRLRRDRLLSSIFEPNARKSTVFNPEARCGPLQPTKECDELSILDERGGNVESDDDDDWQQEVDEDFTFLDSEIELQDVA